MRKQVYAAVVGVFAAATLAVPIAQARHAPGEDPEATSPHHSLPAASSKTYAPTRWHASQLEIDRLGPKYVALHHPQSAAPADANRPGPTAAGTAIANARHDAMPVSVVKVVRPSGFDWAAAGIGAGATGVALTLTAALAMLVTRRRRASAVPKQRELADA
jgi:hypothetical protein